MVRRMTWVHPLNNLYTEKGEFYTLYQEMRHFVPKFSNMHRMPVAKYDRLLWKVSPLLDK